MRTEPSSDAPPALSAPPTGGKRRIRRVVGVALSTLLLAWLGWLGTLQPITQGRVSWPLDTYLPGVQGEEVDAFGVEGTVYEVAMPPDREFTYYISILNESTIGVTVQGLGENPERPYFTREAVGVNLELFSGGQTQAWEPFHPFSLRPGEQAGIAVQVRVAKDFCLGPDGTWYWSQEFVQWSAFGTTGTAVLEMSQEIRLMGTAASSC